MRTRASALAALALSIALLVTPAMATAQEPTPSQGTTTVTVDLSRLGDTDRRREPLAQTGDRELGDAAVLCVAGTGALALGIHFTRTH